MNMERAGLASLVLVLGLVGGCGGGAAERKPVAGTPAPQDSSPASGPAAPQDPEARILVAIRGFKDDMCACTSASCVENVEKTMMEWAQANMAELEGVEPTKAQDEEVDRLDAAMTACKARYVTAPPSPSATLKPLPPGGTGSKACDEYLATFDAVIVTCKDQLGPGLDAMVLSRDSQVDAFAEWATLDEASRKATIEAADASCKAATDAVRQAAASMNCKV